MISQKTFLEKVEKNAALRDKYHRRIIFYLTKIKRFRHNLYKKKVEGDFIFLTICNLKAFPMVRASIYSFLKNSDLIPKKVVIISDGSWSVDVGINHFSDFKIQFEFETWESCAEYFRNKNEEYLYKWAEQQIWGKKMAAILKYAETTMVLFSDPDVLWYGNPVKREYLKNDFYLKLSLDNSHNYDKELIQKMDAEYLYSLPPINCGIVLIKGDMFIKSNILSRSIEIESEKPGDFSEQTIFALMENEFGSVFSENEVSATISDILSPVWKKSRYNNQLKARHYVWNLKWILWRDFLTHI